MATTHHPHSKLLPVIDFTLVIVAGYVAFVVRQGTLAPDGNYLIALVLSAFVTVTTLAYSRVYINVGDRLIEYVRQLFTPLLVAALVLVGIAYLGRNSTAYSRLWAVLWFWSVLGGMVFARWAMIRLGQVVSLRPWLARRTVLVGSPVDIVPEYARLQRENRPWVEVVGLFVTTGPIDGLPAEVMRGDCQTLLDHCVSLGVDEVIVVPPAGASLDEILGLMRPLRLLPVNLHVGPWALLDHFPGADRVDLAGMALINVSHQPLPGLSRHLKWLEDRVLSALLLLLLAPVMVLIAVVVKLDSPGPVLFRQQRYGFGKQVFTVFKFRTMSVSQDDDLGVTQATPGDPRCTRVGRFLRRFSLDELPQLFNVLGGSMSLVGPRPHALPHDDHYAELIDSYLARHRVKPGITGWAQAHGSRGPTDTVDKMEDRVAHDLFYVENWSLLLDVEILLRTVAVVLGGRNAV